MGKIVRIPAIPETLYKSIQSQVGWFKPKTNLLQWFVRPGTWVEKGTVLATYDVNETVTLGGKTRHAEILAPFSGDVLAIQNKDFANWQNADGTTKSGDDFNSEDILFAMSPSNDEDVDSFSFANRALYEVYKSLIIFTETAKVPNSGSIILRVDAKIEDRAY